jgi:hypothetical protein
MSPLQLLHSQEKGRELLLAARMQVLLRRERRTGRDARSKT